ncbi:MAG: FHA domain-containing protein [Chloroflexota bacterium]
MQLTTYIRLFRKWFWLVILGVLLAGGVAFFVTRRQPFTYQSAVTIEVGSGGINPNPDKSSAELAQLLTDSYITKLRLYSVSEATVKALKLPITADDLLKAFQAKAAPNTPIFTVTVTYTDPQIAADIANELANQLILIQSPSSDQQKTVQMLEVERTDLITRIDAQKTELADIEKRLTDASNADQAALTARRVELTNQINASETNLSSFVAQLTKLQQDNNANTVRVIEAARPQPTKVGPTTTINTVLAAVVGAVLAISVIFALEYFNDSIRIPSEVLPLLGVPLIGTIASFGKRKTTKDKLITRSQPSSSVAEAYRALRVSLIFIGKERENEHACLNYVVTSPNAKEGKSVTAANLAITCANAGMHVLLIDADLRNPVQHELFGLSNTAGLSTLLANDTFAKHESAKSEEPIRDVLDVQTETSPLNGSGTVHEAPQIALPPPAENKQLVDEKSSQKLRIDQMRADLSIVMQTTGIAGLDVITSGPVPENPAELLDSLQMKKLIQQLAEKNKVFDVVIFDTPPLLTVSDSMVLSSISKSEVVLVVAASHTPRASAVRAVQRLVALTLPIAGVVVNRLNPRDIDAGYAEQASGQMTNTLPTPNVEAAGLVRSAPMAQRSGATGNAYKTSTVDLRDLLSAAEALKYRNESTDQMVPINKGATRLPALGGLPGADKDTIVMFIGTHPRPITATVNSQITIGRRNPEAPEGSHVDLSAYDAFDLGVSKVHAAIQRDGDVFEVRDLNSSNGTFINGFPVSPQEPDRIKSGDEVRLANMQIRIYFLSEANIPTSNPNEQSGVN